MGFWGENILPRFIDRGMRNDFMAVHRPRAAPLAAGRVLELGAGSGLNIPLYTDSVQHLFALEPSAYLREKAAELADEASFQVDLMDASAESIPLETDSIDTVVSSWTLCSIPDVETSLTEARRVLKPDGRLVFVEHGRAPEQSVSKWQDRLTPITMKLMGCSPNRAMDDLIAGAGFKMLELEKAYVEGPRLISFHYIGQAEPL